MNKKIKYIIFTILFSIIGLINYKNTIQHKRKFLYKNIITIANKKKIQHRKNIKPSKKNVKKSKKNIKNKTKTKNHTKSIITSANTNVDFTKIINKVINTTVSVKNYSSKHNKRTKENKNIFDFLTNNPINKHNNDQKNNIHLRYIGSGVIISPTGYIVTNNHVIENAEKIEVKLNNNKIYKAKLIGKDYGNDIALIKINSKELLPFISFSDSEKIKIGEWVIAIGNPFGLNSTVTAGIISAKGRTLSMTDKASTGVAFESFIQTDAALNPGSSGGALINMEGKLIGINTAIHSSSGTYEGYGFSIPSNLVKKVVEDMKNFGNVKRAYLGLQVLDLEDEDRVAEYNSKNKKKVRIQKGILVMDIKNKKYLEKLGIEIGDILINIDGIPINNFSDLSNIIGVKKPGDKIKTKFIKKNNTLKDYTITLTNAID